MKWPNKLVRVRSPLCSRVLQDWWEEAKHEVVYFFCPSTVPNVLSCPATKRGGGIKHEVLCLSSTYSTQCAVRSCKLALVRLLMLMAIVTANMIGSDDDDDGADDDDDDGDVDGGDDAVYDSAGAGDGDGDEASAHDDYRDDASDASDVDVGVDAAVDGNGDGDCEDAHGDDDADN